MEWNVVSNRMEYNVKSNIMYCQMGWNVVSNGKECSVKSNGI